jgi:hypothetical protein
MLFLSGRIEKGALIFLYTVKNQCLNQLSALKEACSFQGLCECSKLMSLLFLSSV